MTVRVTRRGRTLVGRVGLRRVYVALARLCMSRMARQASSPLWLGVPKENRRPKRVAGSTQYGAHPIQASAEPDASKP
jgi:hypothetical protein